jgi:hypothetical protein
LERQIDKRNNHTDGANDVANRANCLPIHRIVLFPKKVYIIDEDYSRKRRRYGFWPRLAPRVAITEDRLRK